MVRDRSGCFALLWRRRWEPLGLSLSVRLCIILSLSPPNSPSLARRLTVVNRCCFDLENGQTSTKTDSTLPPPTLQPMSSSPPLPSPTSPDWSSPGAQRLSCRLSWESRLGDWEGWMWLLRLVGRRFVFRWACFWVRPFLFPSFHSLPRLVHHHLSL